jgi:hypothetical protein
VVKQPDRREKPANKPVAKRDAAGQWMPGASANPGGRPVGSRPAVLAALDRIGDEAADEIVRKTVAAAKRGDIYARELILRRVWPPRTGSRPVQFPLPEVRKPSDLVKAHATVIAAVADGRLTAGEGNELSHLLTEHLQIVTVNDLLSRVMKLEEERKEEGETRENQRHRD